VVEEKSPTPTLRRLARGDDERTPSINHLIE